MTPELIEQYWPLTRVTLGETLKEFTATRRMVGIINAAEGTYTYKIADSWKTREAIEKDLKMFTFLHDRRFNHITTLLKTKDGADYIQQGSNLIYILKYIEGTHPEGTPDNWAKLGEIMAELHDIQNCPYITEFSANHIIKHNLQDTAKKLSFGDEYLKIVQQQPDYDQFPKTLIHSDIGTGNSIQRPDGEIILIDWDDAGVGTTILDVGLPLIQYFVTEDLEFRQENAKAFYTSYFAKRKLSVLEIEHLFDAGLFFALMYIKYGDTEKRWRRIQWALNNRDILESLYL